MDDSWMLDEQVFAGREHLDREFVAAYDRKQGAAPDEAAAEDLVILRSYGVGACSTVVDLGAGTGRFVATIAPHVGRVIAVDVSDPMLERLQQRVDAINITGVVDIVRSGMLRYEHRGEPADAVHCRNVLHQLPDAFKALALHRIAQLLRPGGVLRLRDLVYDTTPDRFGEHLEGWFAGAVDDPGVGYTAEDLAQHVRTEHSTFTWLLEPMLLRAGFDIGTVRSIVGRTPPTPASAAHRLLDPQKVTTPTAGHPVGWAPTVASAEGVACRITNVSTSTWSATSSTPAMSSSCEPLERSGTGSWSGCSPMRSWPPTSAVPS
jgi:SAM-dependent methyltransferase